MNDYREIIVDGLVIAFGFAFLLLFFRDALREDKLWDWAGTWLWLAVLVLFTADLISRVAAARLVQP